MIRRALVVAFALVLAVAVVRFGTQLGSMIATEGRE